MKIEKKLDIVIEAIQSKKAKNIKLIDIRGVSIIADYFIICSGSSKTNIKAISDEIDKKSRETGIEKFGVEGYGTGTWVLHDLGDIVIHIMNDENRDFYNLERLWQDGKVTVVDTAKN